MTRVFELFAEATGLADIPELQQAHVAKFVDFLHQLPATYRKSPKDRDKPLSQILAEASGKSTGLSATTISRNLDYLGQLLTRAKSEGFANATQIDLGSLRPRKTKRDRDERPAFTADDIQRLFGHPVWQGNLPKQKWQEPGPTVSPDGLYWVPMIAALTGARREEIAGLKAADITLIDGMPVIQIAENANRGLKTLASTRTLPLHPQLIELGLVEQAREQLRMRGADADLFPDLRPPQSGTKFGDQLDYRFRLLVQNRLNGNPEGKVFHSLRHYVTTQLGRMSGVPEHVRKDILGHVGADITSERYSERATLAAMAEAIRQLPRLTITPKPVR
jgi:integrase